MKRIDKLVDRVLQEIATKLQLSPDQISTLQQTIKPILNDPTRADKEQIYR